MTEEAAFVLSQREGLRLRAEMAASSAPIKLRAKVASAFNEPPSQSIVEAVIRGTNVHDQDVVLTARLQEGRFSANDDGSGSANGAFNIFSLEPPLLTSARTVSRARCSPSSPPTRRWRPRRRLLHCPDR